MHQLATCCMHIQVLIRCALTDMSRSGRAAKVAECLVCLVGQDAGWQGETCIMVPLGLALPRPYGSPLVREPFSPPAVREQALCLFGPPWMFALGGGGG